MEDQRWIGKRMASTNADDQKVERKLVRRISKEIVKIEKAVKNPV